MIHIGVLSDTHGVVPQQVYTFFKDCDVLWHCGDLGYGVLDELRAFKPVRAVYGNMDDAAMRYELPETDYFTCDGLRVLMTHIGGWPGHYPPPLLSFLNNNKTDIFLCGHSHILRVMYDKDFSLLHINPGAAGRQGMHKVGTLVRFVIDGTPKDLEVIDFPKC